MYYSKILADLTKQEKNPVNKMYLSEIALKWKNFQQLTENSTSTNSELAEALSYFLAAIDNRKFILNKTRGTGFTNNSPVFSPNYLHDLIAALMLRQPILSESGITWDFQSLDYNLSICGNSPVEITHSLEIRNQKTPSVLSLSLGVDYQYRITGKRFFSKGTLKIPFLLFFAFKKPASENIFLVEHYARMAKTLFHPAQTFVVCESLSEYPGCHFEELPIQIFTMLPESKNQNDQISTETIDKLEAAIIKVLNYTPDSHLIQDDEIEKPAPAPAPVAKKARPPRKTYKKRK